MNSNKQKYTVITGASSGIGYATAKAFAQRGSNLVNLLRQQILRQRFHRGPSLGIAAGRRANAGQGAGASRHPNGIWQNRQ